MQSQKDRGGAHGNGLGSGFRGGSLRRRGGRRRLQRRIRFDEMLERYGLAVDAGMLTAIVRGGMPEAEQNLRAGPAVTPHERRK